MEVRKFMGRLAATIFYISDAVLIISVFLSLVLGLNVSERFIIIVMYTILISFLYLLVRSIKVRILEEEEEQEEHENGHGKH